MDKILEKIAESARKALSESECTSFQVTVKYPDTIECVYTPPAIAESVNFIVSKPKT